jgi:FixJ family two-component response regulator
METGGSPGLRSESDLFVGIIDDDDVLCLSLVDLMGSAGIRAEAFGSAETFLASPSLLLFDCVVTDMQMPGMNGLDLVRGFRQRGGTTPVILISAFLNKHLGDEAVSAGAQCLLGKPFEAAALLDCVEKSLRNEDPSS